MIRFSLVSTIGGLAFFGCLARADEAVLPDSGFAASRYEALWTKSPFAVASPDAVMTSPDYSLVGLSRIDGVSYASLFDKQTQQIFLLTSDKPVRGLTLVSLSHGRDVASTYAIIQRNGESLTLKLEDASTSANPASGAPPAPMNSFAMPGSGSQNAPPTPANSFPMPGSSPQGVMIPGAHPGNNLVPGAGQVPPPALFRSRRIIHVPPAPVLSPPVQNPQNQSH